MNTTRLGACQVLFVRGGGATIEVDLVLAGEATIEGRPLVPGSPVAVSIYPPPQSWSRRRTLQRLLGWADDALPCDADIRVVRGVAVLSLVSAGGMVRGPITDLDVLFASDRPEPSF
jgi:hypothetical protein